MELTYKKSPMKRKQKRIAFADTIFVPANKLKSGVFSFSALPFSMVASILELVYGLSDVITYSRTASPPSTMIAVAALVVIYHVYRRTVAIYLLDFTCYRPPKSHRLPTSMFLENISLSGMDEKSAEFQVKIIEKSGFSEETSIPPSLAQIPIKKSLSSATEEASIVMFSAVKQLLNTQGVNPRAIDILICNSSMFCPVPSLTAMVINRFRMRSNIKSFHLSGMGCSAGVISIGLAQDLLRVHGNSLALIVSSEALHLNWYTGNSPSMLLTNCLFRMGGAAVLLSSRAQDRIRAKYELQHVVRRNKAQDDVSHACVFQDVDTEKKVGVSISKNILNIAEIALKANIAALGPLVLPFSEQLRYGLSMLQRKLLNRRRSLYVPNFRKAFEHFCIHAGGRAVIEEIGKNLKLGKEDVEASKMTLYRFGNTSSSSIWYELCYMEAKGRVKKGDRVWQIAFGSGFKCNSAAWRCVNHVGPEMDNAWRDIIHLYPVNTPQAP